MKLKQANKTAPRSVALDSMRNQIITNLRSGLSTDELQSAKRKINTLRQQIASKTVD